MTNKFDDQKIASGPKGNAPDPVGELAKIIGYDGASDADGAQAPILDPMANAGSSSGSNPGSSATESVLDLEAELLREFGVDHETPPVAPVHQPELDQPEITAPDIDMARDMTADMAAYGIDGSVNVGDPEPVAIPEAIKPHVSMATPQPIETAQATDEVVDDVLSEMEKYDLPGNGQTSEDNIEIAPQISEPAFADTSAPLTDETYVQPNLAHMPDHEPIAEELVSDAPVAEEFAPQAYAPQEFQDTHTYSEQVQLDEPSHELAGFEPAGNAPVGSEPAGNVPANELGASTPEFGDLTISLEDELAKLHDGLENNAGNQLSDQTFQANEALNVSEYLPEPDLNELPEPTVSPEPIVSDAGITEPVVEQAHDVAESAVAGPQSADRMEKIPAEKVEEMLGLSALKNLDDHALQATELDVPELEQTESKNPSEQPVDINLDLELEREFSELFSVDTAADQAAADQAASDQAVEASSTSIPSQTMDDLSAAFGLDQSGAHQLGQTNQPASGEFDGLTPVVAPVLSKPERIDVNVSQSSSEPIGSDLAEEEKNGVSKYALVGLFVAVLIGGGAYLFAQSGDFLSSTGSEPVIIAADKSPIKEKPADPGGALVPNQDQAVYDQVEGNDTTVSTQSELVESAEEPIDIVQQTLNPNLLPQAVSDEGAAVKNDERLTADNTTGLASNQAASQPILTPRKVRTVIVQSDGTIITREVEPEPVTTIASNNADDTTATLAVPTPQAQLQTPAVNVAAAPAVSQPVATPTNEVTPEVINQVANATPAPAAAAQNYSGYYMQIASQPSESAAQASYQNLSNRFSSILGDRGVEYQRADIPGKGVFHRVRIQAGSRSEANSLCTQFKAAGGSCFVTR